MKTILLIPGPRDVHGLLADGAHGARTPTAYLAHVAGKPPKPCPVCGTALKWCSMGGGDGAYLCPTDGWIHKFAQKDVLIPEWQSGRYQDYPRALVLVWEGVICPEGVDRAARCLARFEGMDTRCGVLFRHNEVLRHRERDPDDPWGFLPEVRVANYALVNTLPGRGPLFYTSAPTPWLIHPVPHGVLPELEDDPDEPLALARIGASRLSCEVVTR